MGRSPYLFGSCPTREEQIPMRERQSAPRARARSTQSSQPTHDERGRFAKGNRVGGRTVGAKDKFFSRRGIGSLRRAYQEFSYEEAWRCGWRPVRSKQYTHGATWKLVFELLEFLERPVAMAPQ